MLEYFSWKKIKANRDAAAAKEAETPKSATETAVPAAAAINKPVFQSQNEGPQPILSHRDEEFLREQIENVDEPPIVILEGDSGATTPRPSDLPTPAAETPPTNEGIKDAEEGKGKEKEKEKGDWTSGIKNRFGDLRRTVSNATERKKTKPKSPGPSKEEKGKGKEKQKEEKPEG